MHVSSYAPLCLLHASCTSTVLKILWSAPYLLLRLAVSSSIYPTRSSICSVCLTTEYPSETEGCQDQLSSHHHYSIRYMLCFPVREKQSKPDAPWTWRIFFPSIRAAFTLSSMPFAGNPCTPILPSSFRLQLPPAASRCICPPKNRWPFAPIAHYGFRCPPPCSYKWPHTLHSCCRPPSRSTSALSHSQRGVGDTRVARHLLPT